MASYNDLPPDVLRIIGSEIPHNINAILRLCSVNRKTHRSICGNYNTLKSYLPHQELTLSNIRAIQQFEREHPDRRILTSPFIHDMARDKLTSHPEVLADITADDIVDALQAIEDALRSGHGSFVGKDWLIDDFIAKGYGRLLGLIHNKRLTSSSLAPGSGDLHVFDYIFEYADQSIKSEVVSDVFGDADTFPKQVAYLMEAVRIYDSPYMIKELLILWDLNPRLMNIATRELLKLQQKYHDHYERSRDPGERFFNHVRMNNTQEVLDWIAEHRAK